ncbi:MAG: phytanoyl-CoA dioxygenase family protein [Sphingomonadales bacterium]
MTLARPVTAATLAPIDTDRLLRDGFVVLPGLLHPQEIADFEADIAALVASQLAALGLTPVHPDPFIDLFEVGGAHTDRLYTLMERLMVLQRIGARLGDELRQAGFLRWAGFEAPLLWPDIRADIPGDTVRQLPVHQDFGSTHCARAWRLWIALRPSGPETGTLRLYPGTHGRGFVEHNVDDPLDPHLEPRHYAGVEPLDLDLPAGGGVLFDPMIFHASVPNRSRRTKFSLMLQLQDLAAMIRPDAPGEAHASMLAVNALRAAARIRLRHTEPEQDR